MKHRPNPISINRASAFPLDPRLTSEESIVLRALAAGRTDRQVCNDLRMLPTTFIHMMCEMREKLGTKDNVSLVAWAKRQMKGVDQRSDKPERCPRLA
jgi:DNA-binding NarL/FixJ family response regulator